MFVPRTYTCFVGNRGQTVLLLAVHEKKDNRKDEEKNNSEKYYNIETKPRIGSLLSEALWTPTTRPQNDLREKKLKEKENRFKEKKKTKRKDDHSPFLDTSNSTRFSKFWISGGKR